MKRAQLLHEIHDLERKIEILTKEIRKLRVKEKAS